LAYLAGVLDSDGYIGVKRNTYAMRRVGDCGQPTFSERLCVKQVEPHAVELFKAIFGGTLQQQPASVTRGKPLWSWQTTDRKAAACLVALLPYLRIKRQQAENCLNLRELKEQSKKARVAFGRGHAGSAARPAYLSEAMEEAFRRAKALNAVGI